MKVSVKNSIFATMQKIGKSLMTPVSVLPAAGLLVALGRLLIDLSEDQGLVAIGSIHALGKVLYSGGLAIFEQLPLVFAMGVAIGFTNGAGIAGLAAAVAYFTMINVIKVLGEESGSTVLVNTGVFGGIIIGLLSAKLYHRFQSIKLHPVFGFFSGKRFVPIVAAASAILVGIMLAYVWPPIQMQIREFGAMIMSSEFGPAFYAAGKRALIPVGLHHVYYPPFLYEFGEFVTSAGKTVTGETTRYFSGDPTAGRFMASEFPIMLFGLPAAAFAMYLRAPKSKRKTVAGVMASAALTSIITGITEPIEFAFIFVAPLLYVVHVGAAFGSGVLTSIFDIHLGYTFSASMIDFGLGLFNAKNSFYLFFIVGPLIALFYFSSFYYLIEKFQFQTPGRELDIEDTTSAKSTSSRSREILVALGGAKNILDIDACITRLRLRVSEIHRVDKVRLKELGAAGLLDAGGGNLQVIFGVESDHLKEEIQGLLNQTNDDVPTLTNLAGQILIRAPIKGRRVELDLVPDATFAEKVLGDGVAVEPSEGVVFAPINARISQLFPTNHAIGLESDEGMEILIHIGIDTVKMKGQGFSSFVKVGDFVRTGDKLIEFDLDLVRRLAKSTVTPIVITNIEKFKGIRMGSLDHAIPGEELFQVNI